MPLRSDCSAVLFCSLHGFESQFSLPGVFYVLKLARLSIIILCLISCLYSLPALCSLIHILLKEKRKEKKKRKQGEKDKKIQLCNFKQGYTSGTILKYFVGHPVELQAPSYWGQNVTQPRLVDS